MSKDIGYFIARGFMDDEDVGDDGVEVYTLTSMGGIKAKVGVQLPSKLIYIHRDKQYVIDYYSEVSGLAPNEKEYVIAVDWTSMQKETAGFSHFNRKEIPVFMPYVESIEELEPSDRSHVKACDSCPFARTCKPNALGGGRIETYIGQILGPFFLPCHSVAGYQGNAQQMNTCRRQCAGAARMRANIGVAPLMPDGLLTLPIDRNSEVFANLDEFIAHHQPSLSPLERADMLINAVKFLKQELDNPNVRTQQ